MARIKHKTIRTIMEAHRVRFPDKTTPTDFLLWWAANWEDASKHEVAVELDKLTDGGRGVISNITRAMSWTERPPQ